ncbi:MAG: UDP-N-acetylmuramate dehydrogenase [Paludibacteraceae bacterium]
MNFVENYSLLPHNTFGMDVRARYFVEYDTVDDLTTFLQTDLAHNNQLLPIGAGSNLLFTGDYDGIILHSRIKFCDIVNETDDNVFVRVGAGVVWDDFCADMCARNLGGTENLSYIPGEVGASAVQNIGAYGAEAADIIVKVETIERATSTARIFDAAECDYGYRHSIFKGKLQGRYIVTAVTYRLSKRPVLSLDYGNLRTALQGISNPTVSDVRQAVIDIRRQKLPDPAELGSAGSFFKNPVVSITKFDSLLTQYPTMPHYSAGNETVKIPAAWLIEQCGWKGKTLGGAAVYAKQPLVLVNQNHATPADVQNLAQHIVDSVIEKFGIQIEPEANYI